VGMFDAPLAIRVGNSRPCVRLKLGVRCGYRGEGPGLVRVRVVRCVMVGSRRRWRLRGMVIAVVRGMEVVVGAG
jgi:hypothetical protein